MVSSLTTLLRRRRGRQSNKKKKSATAAEVESIQSTSILTDQDLASLNGNASFNMTTTASVEEIIVLNGETPRVEESVGSKIMIVESTESIDPCGCPLNMKTMKNVVKQVPDEYKEAAISSVLLTAALTGLFFSIVFYRYLHHLYSPEPEGFFCSLFSTTFFYLFDALCGNNQPIGFFAEIYQESQKLAEEVGTGLGGFFASIFDGFYAFRTIFTVMFRSLLGNIGYGVHELVENVSENIAFLSRFCVQCIDFVLYIFNFTVSQFFHYPLNILTHVQSYFQ